MKIELKGLKVAASLSEETTAYTASIYVDGVRAFEASNHGTGGPDMYRRVSGYEGPTERQINEWLRFHEAPTGPHDPDPAKRGDWDNGIPMDLELFVGELLGRVEEDKRVRSALKKLCSLKGGQLYTWKAAPTPESLATGRAKVPDHEFINDKVEEPGMRERIVAAIFGKADEDRKAGVLRRLDERTSTLADADWLLWTYRLHERTSDEVTYLLEVQKEGKERENRHKDWIAAGRPDGALRSAISDGEAVLDAGGDSDAVSRAVVSSLESSRG